MKTLIVYASRYGTTEKCAKMVAEGLKGDVHLHRLTGRDKVDLAGYDVVILGSSIRIGSFLKPAKQFMENYGDALMKKKLGLFLCCGAPYGGDKYFGLSVPENLLNHAITKVVFGGEMNLDKMNLIDRTMVKMGNQNKPKPTINKEAIQQFIETMNAQL